MDTYDFVLVLDRRVTDDDLDALVDHGCDDATPERVDGRTLLHFDREAADLAIALVSAVHDVESAGLHVAAVQSDDLVSVREIAHRLGRSYESVRLLAAGERGPGGFPPPIAADGWTLYSWSQVAAWFTSHYPQSPLDRQFLTTEYDRVVAAADHLLRARAILGDSTADFANRLIA